MLCYKSFRKQVPPRSVQEFVSWCSFKQQEREWWVVQQTFCSRGGSQRVVAARTAPAFVSFMLSRLRLAAL